MKRIVPGQRRIGPVMLLLGSLAATCGCEVRVAVGVDDESADPVTKLFSSRLKHIVDRSRDAASEPEAETASKNEEVNRRFGG